MFDVGLGDGRFSSRLKRRLRQGKTYCVSVLDTGETPVLMVASGTNSVANCSVLTLISVRTRLAYFGLRTVERVRLDVRFAVRIKNLRTS